MPTIAVFSFPFAVLAPLHLVSVCFFPETNLFAALEFVAQECSELVDFGLLLICLQFKISK